MTPETLESSLYVRLRTLSTHSVSLTVVRGPGISQSFPSPPKAQWTSSLLGRMPNPPKSSLQSLVSPSSASSSPSEGCPGLGSPQILRPENQHQANFPRWGQRSATSAQALHPDGNLHWATAQRSWHAGWAGRQGPWVSSMLQDQVVSRAERPGAARYEHLPMTWSCPKRKGEGTETLRFVTAVAREAMGSFPWWAAPGAVHYQHANHPTLLMTL